ncbi:Gag polyprotein [Vulpes lagopus]
MVFRDKPDSHPDQVPYILIWQDMIKNPPAWLKPFLPPKAGPTEILALWKAEKETDSTPQAPFYPVFQDSSPEGPDSPATLPGTPSPFCSSIGGTGGQCRRGASPP